MTIDSSGKSIHKTISSANELADLEFPYAIGPPPPMRSRADENAKSKRPHSAIESLADPEPENEDGHDSDTPITSTCDEIRRKITKLLNSGEMKVTEFQRACNINSNSYGRFMKLKGAYAGDGNQTYSAAFQFFKQREAAGVKEPIKKKAKKSEESKKLGHEAAGVKEPTKKKVKKSEESKELDVSSIELEGEDEETVEIYDTCDEVRRKIAAYLREPNVTQAAFLREIVKGLPDPGVKIQSKQLKDFQTKKGPLAGNQSKVFYAAYVFFEKQRILQGKPKSKKRLEMEDVWGGQGGIDRERQGKYLCTADATPYMDAYGRVRC